MESRIVSFRLVIITGILLLGLFVAACQTEPQSEDSQEAAQQEVDQGEQAESAEEPIEQEAEEAEEPLEEEEAEEPREEEEAEPTEEPMEEEAAEPLIVLIDNDEGPITPANYNTFIGLWMLGWIYDPLFARAPDLSPIPGLATEATPSEDGLSWEIKLRDDVTWHDGEPFTAEDVVFSYNFLIEAGRAPNLGAVDTVEAVGEHELLITLTDPAPFFLSEGLAAYYIMPEHIWGDQEPVSGELSQFQGQVGTGPYMLEEISPGESYTFSANPDYFRGQPEVDQIIAKIVKDRTQQINQLRSGEASAVLSSVPPAQVGQLSDSEDIALAQGSDFFNYVLYINGSRPPFDQVGVRQAIAKAIDAETLMDIVLLGNGTVLPMSWYHPDLPWAINVPRNFNPEAAAALLDEAGIRDSDGDGIREFDGQPTDYEILCDVNNPVEIRATELIAGWLGDVGIGASQNCQDIDTSVAQIWPNFVAVPDPDYDMAIWGWSAVPQFQRGFLRGLFDSDFGGVGWGNLTGISDPILDELMAEYVSNPDFVRTEELNRLIQERIAENLPLIPLMSPDGNFAYRPESYDGWVYMRGTGIVPVWSFLPAEASQ